jgi:hypothetical protein
VPSQPGPHDFRSVYFGYRDATTNEPSEPNPKQRLAHACDADELLYGGAAGGGKSEWLLLEAGTVCLEHAGVEVALFRRTYEELEASLILRSQALFPKDLAKYEAGRKRWKFKNGSILWFRYCARESDVYRYQSAQWVMLGLDEATHFTEYQYTYLTSRVRSRFKGVKARVRLASNPGNVGHAWVKARFIDPTPLDSRGIPIHPYQVWTPASPPDRPTQKMMTRCFVPAKVQDNAALMTADPDYWHRLQALPEDERRMLSEGDWDVWKGQVFDEFRTEKRVLDSDLELRAHGLEVGTVIPWHRIPDDAWTPPDGALIYFSVDYGYAAPWAVHFHAVLAGGRTVTFKEFYLTGKRDVIQAQMLRAYVERIREHHKQVGRELWNIQWGVMDRSMWGSRMEQGLGKSIAEVYDDEFARPCGLFLKQGSTDRHARVQRVKAALSTAPDGFPWWQITAACPNLLRTLPQLPFDPDDREDVDTDAEDHAYDEVGLFWQARPSLPKPKQRDSEFAVLDELSRTHQEAMAKRHGARGKPTTLDVRGFVLR